MMSEARTVWHDLETRQKVAANRQRSGVLLAAGLLIAMGAAEALFLTYVAGPDTVDLLTAGQGAPAGGE
jgi:hypothetical protein